MMRLRRQAVPLQATQNLMQTRRKKKRWRLFFPCNCKKLSVYKIMCFSPFFFFFSFWDVNSYSCTPLSKSFTFDLVWCFYPYKEYSYSISKPFFFSFFFFLLLQGSSGLEKQDIKPAVVQKVTAHVYIYIILYFRLLHLPK